MRLVVNLPSWLITVGERDMYIMKSLPVLFRGLLMAEMSSTVYPLLGLAGLQLLACQYSVVNISLKLRLKFTSGQPGHIHFKNNPSSCSCSITAMILAANFSLSSATSDILIMFVDVSQSEKTPITLTPALRRVFAFIRVSIVKQLELYRKGYSIIFSITFCVWMAFDNISGSIENKNIKVNNVT
jgi:hypothetical protein